MLFWIYDNFNVMKNSLTNTKYFHVGMRRISHWYNYAWLSNCFFRSFFHFSEAVGLLKIPRTQSAPSVVGLVEEDHKKKKV